MTEETTPVPAPEERAVPVNQSIFPDNIPNDPSLLLVRGKMGENKPYIKTLSHATLTVVAKYGYASLKCVGASAVNNALKAIVIASGEAKKRGINLVISPSFQEAIFDNVEKTAIMLSVFDR